MFDHPFDKDIKSSGCSVFVNDVVIGVPVVDLPLVFRAESIDEDHDSE